MSGVRRTARVVAVLAAVLRPLGSCAAAGNRQRRPAGRRRTAQLC